MRVQLTLPWLHVGIECENEQQFEKILTTFFKQARENEDLAFGVTEGSGDFDTVH